MKKYVLPIPLLGALLGLGLGVLTASDGFAQEKKYSNQVFFRGGYSMLSDNRGGEVFTDTATGGNNGDAGLSLSAGLDLALTEENELFGWGTLMGEIYMSYEKFSDKQVLQTTSALLAGTAQSNVSVAMMNATIAPKLRIDTFGRIRPFLIPLGLSWLVNSPPSNDTTYLDLGIPFAIGVDFKLFERLSLGADLRYTLAFNDSNTENTYMSTGAYAGVNF